MHAPPDDPAARREWLERWVEKQVQEGRIAEPEPLEPPRLKRLFDKWQARFAYRAQRLADSVFERGLDSAAFAMEPEHDHPDRVQYVASPWHVLPRALRYLGVSERDTFIDFGCGKGRVVHQAAKRRFRRVIGVEISPKLAEIARANLAARAHQHRCPSIEIVVADATEFEVPDDLTIAYLCHPFKNETLDSVLRVILDSVERNPRPVRLIYVCPRSSDQVLGTGRFRLLKNQNSILDTPLSRVEIFETL
jgi:SAM-dependent methyltransferase